MLVSLVVSSPASGTGDIIADPSANPNEVKFHMDRDQVAKCAQQCNMKKRMSPVTNSADV